MFSNKQGGLDALFNRPEPAEWQKFIASPLPYLARLLYRIRQNLSQTNHHHPANGVKVVCISDTHNTKPIVPHGDLLVHAGDLTQAGSVQEVREAVDWLQSLSHPHNVVVAGNHDICLDSEERAKVRWGDIVYLQDELSDIRFSNGRVLRVFGSPWTPTPGTWAFTYSRKDDVWNNKIPTAVDILVTHMPPKFHLDVAGYGDGNLLGELWRTRPRLHVFGHIHAGYGQDTVIYDRFEQCFESICDAKQGLVALIQMCYCLATYALRPRKSQGTLLVNAAAVGGLHDEEQGKPVTVVV